MRAQSYRKNFAIGHLSQQLSQATGAIRERVLGFKLENGVKSSDAENGAFSRGAPEKGTISGGHIFLYTLSWYAPRTGIVLTSIRLQFKYIFILIFYILIV